MTPAERREELMEELCQSLHVLSKLMHILGENTDSILTNLCHFQPVSLRSNYLQLLD